MSLFVGKYRNEYRRLLHKFRVLVYGLFHKKPNDQIEQLDNLLAYGNVYGCRTNKPYFEKVKIAKGEE